MADNYDDYINSLLEEEVIVERKPQDTVYFQELVELFVSVTVPDIMDEYEVPRVNFIFSDEAISWLRNLLKNPFKKEGYDTQNMTEDDINRLCRENQNDSNCPTIVVKDYKLFFQLLTDIVNEQIDLYFEYRKGMGARRAALLLLRRLWLRMNVEDFNDVELFLEKQLEFLKNREFDNPFDENSLGIFDRYFVFYGVELCETWCESTRRMYFRIYDGLEEHHDLPNVYYDICEENGEKVCYVSAVQCQKYDKRIKSIERKLYKLNKNIPDSKVHPNFLMAMKLFYEVLRKYNISHIKVPIIQVLSYRYHELLSEQEREIFEKKWTEKQLKYLYSLRDSACWQKQEKFEGLMKEYEYDRISYDRFVDKEDFISKNKIEGLINLFTSMTYLDDMMAINTEPFIDASYLDISLDDERKLDSKRGR